MNEREQLLQRARHTKIGIAAARRVWAVRRQGQKRQLLYDQLCTHVDTRAEGHDFLADFVREVLAEAGSDEK